MLENSYTPDTNNSCQLLGELYGGIDLCTYGENTFEFYDMVYFLHNSFIYSFFSLSSMLIFKIAVFSTTLEDTTVSVEYTTP